MKGGDAMGRFSPRVLVIMGVVMLAIAFMIFPIVLDAADEILNDRCPGDRWVIEEIGNISLLDDCGYAYLTYELCDCNIDYVASATENETELTIYSVDCGLNKVLLCGFPPGELERSANVTYYVCCDPCADYPGLCPVVQVAPLIVFTLMLFGGLGLTGYGIYSARSSVV